MQHAVEAFVQVLESYRGRDKVVSSLLLSVRMRTVNKPFLTLAEYNVCFNISV